MVPVSFPGPFGDSPDDPFAAMAGMINQFLATFTGSGGAGWDQAKQMAAAIANEGRVESNVDPVDRIAFEQLGRVAELHVSELIGHPVTGRVTLVSRSQWTAATVDDYRPLFERLAGSLGAAMKAQLDSADPDELAELGELTGQSFGPDPAAFLAGMSQMMGPMMMSMMAGSTVGQLGTRVFGSYDLPIPRPQSDQVMIIADEIASFGSDWDIAADDLRLWVCIEQLAAREVFHQPAVQQRLLELLAAHADGFTADMSGLEEHLAGIDPMSPEGIEALGEVLGDPDVVLGAMRSPAQEALLPSIDAIVCIAGGYVDWLVDTVAQRLLPDHRRISEAMRRRRVETDQASRFVERLFGLELTQAKFDQGGGFVATVVERVGEDALARLWSAPEMIPTAAELSSPGLWLARVGLDQGVELPELSEDVEIPDFPDLDS
jgi:putative hydrolase